MGETKNSMISGEKCSTCGEIFNGEWQYCPKCGKRVPPAPLEQQTADKPKVARELLYLAVERDNDYAIRYFQAKLMNDYSELEEKEINFGEWVYSEEYWGYRECRSDPHLTIYMPIYTEDYYKENEDFIKQHNESYRRQYLFKLPELRIM